LAIADAAVLIALAKMQSLGLLKQLYGQMTLGPSVKPEVIDDGRAVSAPGVEQVEAALDEGWIQLTRLSAREKRTMPTQATTE